MKEDVLMMKMSFLCVFSLLTAAGCENQGIEQRFFDAPLADRVQRLRHYPLEDQYRIFRYGNDKIHPPLMELADPIAERGAAAVPFLLARLKSESDDLAVRDILLILETMNRLKSCDVKSNGLLMSRMTSMVAQMKDKEWQSICFTMLQRIKSST